MEKLVVVGQGYVGLPLAVRAVDAGFDVVGVEVDEWRVKRLNAAQSYVEDVGDDALAAAHATGRYRASASSNRQPRNLRGCCGSFCRRQATGMSDRMSGAPTLEERMDDFLDALRHRQRGIE